MSDLKQLQNQINRLVLDVADHVNDKLELKAENKEDRAEFIRVVSILQKKGLALLEENTRLKAENERLREVLNVLTYEDVNNEDYWKAVAKSAELLNPKQ